jgi:glycosyltransferase involved in cell wall biosynthesis
MALGTTVVSTDVAGIPDVVHHGETGLQVPQHDPVALAAAIERLLAEPGLGVRLATNARGLMEAEFNIRHNTERRRAIFRGEGPQVEKSVKVREDTGATPILG